METSALAMFNFYSSVSLQNKVKMLDVLAMATEQTPDFSCVLIKAFLEWTWANQACGSCIWFSYLQCSVAFPTSTWEGILMGISKGWAWVSQYKMKCRGIYWNSVDKT